MRLRLAILPVLLSLLSLSGLLILSGCHGSGITINIEIMPTAAQTIDEGQSINFLALVGGDTTNDGVTWKLSGGGCAGTPATGCGSLTNVTKMGVTYTAPPSISASTTVTLTATSVAQSGTTGIATITINLPQEFTTTALPNGANGVPYNQTIVVTDGVTPYTYRITSGILPPGLSLNATSGAIVGTPSAPLAGQPPAVYNFTLTVGDSGGATPIFEPLSITVTPPPTLSITSTSLPAGTTNVQYAASILTQGGVAPLTFSLVGGGNFPVPGLTLNPTTGQITGVPTTPGPYTFMISVTDSSLPAPGQNKQATITLVVVAPPPLLITTPSLPNGVTAQTPGYVGTIQATGGEPPYTWSIIQGQLPSGLALSTLSNGSAQIVGTPVLAGMSTFTVQVQDSEVVPVTRTAAFSITITPGTGNDALFSGSYSFLFQGFNSGGAVALAGSFTADGQGNISSGQEDSSTSTGILAGIALTGTYSIGSDGRGTLELKATDPRNPNTVLTTDYQLVLEANGTAHMFENNSTTTSTDINGTHGEAIVKPVSGTFSATTLSGNYAFEFSGPDFNGKRAAFAGMFHANGGSTLSGGTSDLNDAGTETSQSLSGDFTFAAGNEGGAHLVFQPPSQSQITLTFNFYFVSASDIFFIETDMSGQPLSPPNSPRLSGEAILQQPTAVFGATTSLSVPGVATGTGLDSTKADIFAGLLPAATCDGLTAFTLPYDQNDGGTTTTPSPLSGTCTATPNGRVAFSWIQPPMPPAAAIAPRFVAAYLTAPGQGFLIGGDAAVTTGRLDAQSGGPFTDASIEGSYALSTPFSAEANVNNAVGQVAGNGAGSVPGTVDEFDAPTSTTTEGKANLAQALATNINTLAANGRGTLTTNSPIGFLTNAIFYMVSPGNMRWMPTDPGANPQIFLLNH